MRANPTRRTQEGVVLCIARLPYHIEYPPYPPPMKPTTVPVETLL